MSTPIVHFTDAHTFGGAERSMLHVIEHLDRDRWYPVLFHHDEPGLEPLLKQVRARAIPTRLVPPVRGLGGLARIPAFREVLRDIQPAVFHAHLNWPLGCSGGLLAAALHRVPAVVATAQLFGSLPGSSSVRLLRRLVPPLVDRYVAVSEHVKDRLQAELHVKAEAIRVIPNGVDGRPFDVPAPPSAALRASLDVAPDGPLVLCVARLEAQKGHRYLLEAIPQVPDAVFAFAGDGPARANLEAQADRLGVADRVRFLGFRSDIHDLLRTCTVFVLPSLYEGLPLSVLEAMAAGTPVVATDIGGTAEAVVHGQTGLLVPPAQPGPLAKALRQLLAEPARAQRLAEAGRARFTSSFSARHMAQAVAGLYEGLLDA